MGARGHGHQTVLMDYPKNCGSRHGPGIPLLHGQVIPECSYPLLGQDLLTKMGAQICFHPEGAKVLNKKGHPIQVLVLSLEDEYRLHQMPSVPMTDIDRWLREFPQAWAETGGIGLAQHRPAIYIELKPGADPVRARQYPMPLVARRESHPTSGDYWTRGGVPNPNCPNRPGPPFLRSWQGP